MIRRSLTLASALALVLGAQSARPWAAPPHVETVPPCSALHYFPQVPIIGPNQPYMKLMRAVGVARALVGVRGVWQQGSFRGAVASGPRLYFRCYDCAFAEFTDTKALDRIQRSGLASALDAAAVNAAPTARLLTAPEHNSSMEGKSVEALVPLFDAQGAPGFAVPTWPVAIEFDNEARRLPTVARAWDDITVGDLAALVRLLHRARPGPATLDRMLVGLDSGPYDPAGAIAVLVALGADPNARDDAGETALMSALTSPLGVQELLKLGADPWQRVNGQTALDLLRKREKYGREPTDSCTERFLLAAMGAKSKS